MRKLLFPSNRLDGYFFGFFLLFLLIPCPAGAYHGSDRRPALSFGETIMDIGGKVGETLADDGDYFLRSVFSDIGDALKLPFEDHEINARSIVTGALVMGSIPATIYGLDNPIRRNVRNIPDGTRISYGILVWEGP